MSDEQKSTADLNDKDDEIIGIIPDTDNNDGTETTVVNDLIENAEETVHVEKELVVKKNSAGFNPFKSKKFKYGGLSVLFTVIFVSVIILINVITNTVLARFDVEIDLTENKLFSIEEQTAEFLKALDDEINITVASNEADFTGARQEYKQTDTIAKRFSETNSNININYIDLLQNPSLSGKYGGELTQVSIIVESKKTGRYKVLTPDDYVNVTYFTTDGQQLSYEEANYYYMLGMQVVSDVSASAEQALLSAIMSVSNDTPVRVAFASGFGEGSDASSQELIYKAFSDLLEKNAYVVETLDLLLTDTIDTGLDYLVIFAPNNDYDIDTLTKIDKWLDNSGKFRKNVIYVASVVNPETPNLDGFLADWGIRVEKGGIYQTDTAYATGQSGYSQYMMLDESDFGKSIKNGTFFVSTLRAVTPLFSESGNLVVTPILSSFEGAIVVPMDADENWPINEAEKGTFHGIVESKKLSFEGTTPYISRVIAFGGPYIFNSSYLSASQLSNSRLFIDIFNVISGKEEGVVLTPKPFAMTSFEISAQTANTIAVVFAIVLPIIIISCGIAVYLRRKHK